MTALEDREAVRDVLVRYALAVDRKQIDRVAACFTPDCDYEGALGHGTIGHALRALELAFARYARTMHLLGTQAIEVDGDVARAETYCVAHHVRPDGGHLAVGVRYQDDLVRGPTGWLIRRRIVHTDWSRDTP
jgi:3-phenylpropionate/cinnamic acid dioxygenase small subunit